jgi:ribosomal protein S18 acetylase RimI-like enzyme
VFRHDPWLSGHLRRPSYYWAGKPSACRAELIPDGAAFLWAKVDAEDVEGLINAQATGFRVVDTNVCLARPAAPSDPAPGKQVRFARSDDEAAVRRIAASEFRFDRFHRDPAVANETADRIKQEWAGNYFAGGRGEWMVVAEAGNAVVGFMQLLRGQQDSLVIDLIAVTAEQRGGGLARAMIGHAVRECLGRDAAMTVGTQIANLPSLALYEGLGFRIVSADHVLHLHREVSHA